MDTGHCLWVAVESVRGLLVSVCERPPRILEATGSLGGERMWDRGLK